MRAVALKALAGIAFLALGIWKDNAWAFILGLVLLVDLVAGWLDKGAG